MARQKEFDRSEALEAAVAVFWGKNYEATTTGDLLARMGIARQSLYDTFGDKRGLYLEALRHYSVGNVTAFGQMARKSASPLAAIRALLFSVADGPPQTRARGCLGVQSISDFGTEDAEVAAIAKTSTALFRSTLEQVLDEAKAMGEVRDNLNTRQAAKCLHALLLGMRVRARAGDSREDLVDMAASSFEGLLNK
jgi:AcrR family transcriptional regulator